MKVTVPALDPDRRLALAYAAARARPALEALWRLDVTLGAVLATGRDPMVSRIRLAWWREALEKLDDEAPPPEPVLEAVAAHLLPAAELAAIVDGWEMLLAEGPLDDESLQIYAAARGGTLFRHSARILGAPDFPAGRAGRLWALVDLARHSADSAEADAALDAAAQHVESSKWPRALRPLGMLAALARRDLSRGRARWDAPGSPARMIRMLHHRLTGN